MKIILLFLLLIPSLASAADACHRHTTKPAPTTIRIASDLFNAFAPVRAFAPSPQPVAKNEACEFLKFIDRWKGWRQRNPNKDSRFPALREYKINTALYFGSSEPEPDPGGIACGCDFAFAVSAGCGWWHAATGGM